MEAAFVLCALLVIGSHSLGAVLAHYDISSEDGGTDLDPTLVHANITVSGIRRIGGLMPNTQIAEAAAAQGFPNFAFVSTEWPANAFGAQAMEITFTPAPGFGIRFETMRFAFGGFPKTTFRVATSTDNFASSIFGPFVSPAAGFVRDPEDDSLLALPLQTGPITFRWYAFRDTSVPDAGGPWVGFFDEDAPVPIIFTGAVQPLDFRITAIEKIGNDVRLSFTSTVGKTYRIEHRSVLESGSWQTLASGIAGTGAVVQFTDLGTLGAGWKFYRVASVN